eukprot:GEMP01078184.1.p2 GENE.GEMP01078184.1~~GEMP01078184.1.p2  ORF type:complete len:139 (+),score=26.94 GEMP01078184.1:424-840(+)
MSPFIFDDPVAIRMMQIDSTAETAASYVLRNDNKSADGNEIEVCLLFKPGHYDILYMAAEGKLIQRVEMEPEVLDCREVVNCTVCLSDEALPDRPDCGCSVGLCADCREGYLQNHMEGYSVAQTVPCPACNSPWALSI